MLQINHVNSSAIQATAAIKRHGYSNKSNAQRAAVHAIGPHAREGFEFETTKVDGLWYWRRHDTVRPDTEAQLKANGGKRAALVPGDDGSDIPAMLRRPAPTTEQRDALIAKHSRTVGPDRVIKNPPNVSDVTKTTTATEFNMRKSSKVRTAKNGSTAKARGTGKTRTDASPSEIVANILKLASRANGVTPAELNTYTKWKGAPWKWLFKNPKKTGYCDRWGYSLSVDKSDGETRYKVTKKAA